MMLCLLSGGKVEGGVRVGGGYAKVKAMEERERGGGAFMRHAHSSFSWSSQNASSYLFRNVRSLLPAKETKKKKRNKNKFRNIAPFPTTFQLRFTGGS